MNKNIKKTRIDAHERVEKNGYDRGIIPAETAARMEREKDNYKKIPSEADIANTPTNDQSDTYSIRTTDGYTVDQEGLLNNYPVEPEMYYETRGDAREKLEEDKAERLQELKEVNDNTEGKRGKGTGII
ncbi:MAG: hypothetical protein EAZ76_16430 [Nostocales cyanobacterium]|nr:MAG: hypothetical protein EAZ87_16875 [Nostocales cyanobacterium]TAF09238.1 MAG: hypothetical protein EAZ76_16430 [Nostocales cyanobacterium]